MPWTGSHGGPLKLSHKRKKVAPKWVLLGPIPNAEKPSLVFPMGPVLAAGLAPVWWPSAELG